MLLHLFHLISPHPLVCAAPALPRRLRQLAALFKVDWDAAEGEQLYGLAEMMNNAAAAADPPGVSHRMQGWV